MLNLLLCSAVINVKVELKIGLHGTPQLPLIIPRLTSRTARRSAEFASLETNSNLLRYLRFNDVMFDLSGPKTI